MGKTIGLIVSADVDGLGDGCILGLDEGRIIGLVLGFDVGSMVGSTVGFDVESEVILLNKNCIPAMTGPESNQNPDKY